MSHPAAWHGLYQSAACRGEKSQMVSSRPGSRLHVQVAPCHSLPSLKGGFFFFLPFLLSGFVFVFSLFSLTQIYSLLKSSTCCWTTWRVLCCGINLKRWGREGAVVLICRHILESGLKWKTNKLGKLVGVLLLARPSWKIRLCKLMHVHLYFLPRFPRRSLESSNSHRELQGRWELTQKAARPLQVAHCCFSCCCDFC